ncbi:hypothetical protein AVEN_59837-1 [Araneus ventricosus]|uniref:Uncharacterized protein n=1 Tax=Araneus ventricosus TaxID=182803 RepID=A0A4Y2SQU9_ARAVE|nr:hypothetical protein AVEN_59837-1 [Araneus ventricosus]
MYGRLAYRARAALFSIKKPLKEGIKSSTYFAEEMDSWKDSFAGIRLMLVDTGANVTLMSHPVRVLNVDHKPKTIDKELLLRHVIENGGYRCSSSKFSDPLRLTPSILEQEILKGLNEGLTNSSGRGATKNFRTCFLVTLMSAASGYDS